MLKQTELMVDYVHNSIMCDPCVGIILRRNLSHYLEHENHFTNGGLLKHTVCLPIAAAAHPCVCACWITRPNGWSVPTISCACRLSCTSCGCCNKPAHQLAYTISKPPPSNCAVCTALTTPELWACGAVARMLSNAFETARAQEELTTTRRTPLAAAAAATTPQPQLRTSRLPSWLLRPSSCRIASSTALSNGSATSRRTKKRPT